MESRRPFALLRVFRRLLLGLTFGFLLAPAAPADAAPARSILILVSESVEMPALATIVSEVVAAVRAAPGDPVNVFTESLERSRFPEDDQRLLGLFRERYAAQPPDLVLAVCAPAVDFVRRYRGELFRDTPLLYSFVDERMARDLGNSPLTTGVALRPDFASQMEMALRLHPRVRHLIVVGGVSEFDRGWEASLRQVIPQVEGRVSVRYLVDRSLPETLGNLATLPEDSLIVYTSMSRDKDGSVFVPRDVMDMIRRVSRVPVYGPAATYVGHGVVGGSVMDFEAHGRDVGRMAARLLAGAPVSAVKPGITPNRLVFDGRELTRFAVPDSALPPGAEILYRPSDWTIDPGWLAAVLALIAAQTTLIVALVAQRRKRAALQRNLDGRLEFGTLLSEVSTALSAAPLRGLDGTIRSVLERIRQHADVDVVAVLDSGAGPSVVRAADPSGTGGGALEAARSLLETPFVALKLASFQPVAFGTLGEVPRDAAALRALLEGAGVRSVAMVRMEVGTQALGVLCCLSRTRETAWTAERRQQLLALAEVIANALQRERTATAVADSDRLRGSILSSISAQIAVLDRTGLIIAVNDAWTAFGRMNDLHDEASISPGVNYLDVCRLAASAGVASAEDVLEGIRGVCDGGRRVFEHEYRCDSPADDRWFQMKVVPLRRPEGGAVVTHREITVERRQDIALRELGARLIGAQEEERRRIARELHDDLQQRLALLAIELDGMALGRPLGGQQECVTHARRLWHRTNEIASEIHRISHRLMPLKLETLGLLATLDAFCREAAQEGVRAVFTHRGVPAAVPDDVALCLFRIVQEALRNVVKHSGATEAQVSLTGGDGRLHLLVADAGRGFDVSAALASGGLGLVSMRERLRPVNGEIRMQSALGAGTRIEVRVPLPTGTRPAEAGS